MTQLPPLALPRDSFDEIETPFQGDQLGREALAKKLTTYIDRLRAGAVLGIDAPWGEGKSWFGRHWAAKLKADGHKVAFIDAFENDYIEDPFVLIAAELADVIGDAQGIGSTLRSKAAGVAKALVPMSTKALVNIAGRFVLGVSDASGELQKAFEKAAEGAADGAEKWIEGRIDAVLEERKSLRSFRTTLAAAAKASDKPIVVFIDELDRCKPSFAVTLIERLKHLFDVENLVFVLLMNRRQLEIAIQGQYGQGTDGQTYLGKFVNLWFELPRVGRGQRGSMERPTKFAAQMVQRYGFHDPKPFHGHLAVWAEVFDLSLRDIDKMCALLIMAGGGSSGLLGFLVALKVKRPDLFSAVQGMDREGCLECVQILSKFVQGEAADAQGLGRWENCLLIGISEVLRSAIGDIADEDCTVLRSSRAHLILPNSYCSDLAHEIRSQAARLDLGAEVS